MDYRRSFLIYINALACLKAEIMMHMLMNIHFSYTVQNHSDVTVLAYCIMNTRRIQLLNINFITRSKAEIQNSCS